MTPRTPPNLRQKLCAAYLRILALEGRGIPFTIAAQMTEKDIEALFEVDHDPVLACNGGTNHPSNLVPRSKAVHGEKTKRDRKVIAKGKRLARSAQETRAIILARVGQLADAEVMRRKARNPLPCGKRSGWKKPINGNAVRRVK